MASVPIPPVSYERPAAAPPPQSHAIDYVGSTGTMFGIFYKNLVLTILTLGIYRFWAKTRLRRFRWANTRVDGEGFEYTGTGKELFLGFLKAMAVLIPLFLGLQLLGFVLFGGAAPQAIAGMQGILLFVLVYVGAFAARRYRMSRTNWRGIRFQQDGSPWRYAGLALKGIFLSIVTLGLYFPLMQTSLARYETENLRFGTQPFEFAGRGYTIWKPFFVLWIGSVGVLAVFVAVMAKLQESFDLKDFADGLAIVPALGFVAVGSMSFYYQARFARFRAESTRMAGLQFAMPRLTGWRLFRLFLGNNLIVGLSIGILTPLAMQRIARFWAGHLTTIGTVDLQAISQAERAPRTGEGIAGFLDIDVG